MFAISNEVLKKFNVFNMYLPQQQHELHLEKVNKNIQQNFNKVTMR